MREATERPKQALSGETTQAPSERVEPANERRDMWGSQFRGGDALCTRQPNGRRIFWVSKDDLERFMNRPWTPILWGDTAWAFALQAGKPGTPVMDRSLYAYEMSEEDFQELHATDPARQRHNAQFPALNKAARDSGPGGIVNTIQKTVSL